MSNALKGALLSGLILPGLGQVFLKCYARGAVLILTALLCLSAMMLKAIEYALAIQERLGLNGEAFNLGSISKASIQASSVSDSLSFNVFAFLLLFCWIFGVVDAYRIGKKTDIAAASARSLNGGDH